VSNSIQVRELDNLHDQNLARKIFDITWSINTGTEITPNLLQAMVHSGSYLSGAYIDNIIVGAALPFQQQIMVCIFTHTWLRSYQIFETKVLVML